MSNNSEARPPVILINPPWWEGCDLCGRPLAELVPFGGPGDPCVGDFKGAFIVKTFREELPDLFAASRECRDCIHRHGSLWEIEKEDRIGRPLTDEERKDLRYEYEKCISRWLAGEVDQ